MLIHKQSVHTWLVVAIMLLLLTLTACNDDSPAVSEEDELDSTSFPPQGNSLEDSDIAWLILPLRYQRHRISREQQNISCITTLSWKCSMSAKRGRRQFGM